MNIETEILIIGGGIAGLCAAKEATTYQAKVMLIDKKEELTTPQTEYITKKSLRQLNIKANHEWIINETKGFTLNAPDETKIVLDEENVALPEPSYIVNMDKLTKDLQKSINESDVTIKLGTTATKIKRQNNKVEVTIEDNENTSTITTDILVIAEGTQNNLAKQVELDYDNTPDKTKTLIQYEITSNNIKQTDTIDMYYGSHTPGGSICVMPKDENTQYITIATQNNKTDNTQQHLEDFIKNQLKIDDYEINNKIIKEIPGNGVSRERVQDNIILTGDAAGFINPLTNMKIDAAIGSGTYAGIVASNLVFDGDYQKEYVNKFTMYTDMLINEDFTRYNETRKFLQSLTDDDLNTMARELKENTIYESDIDNIIRAMIDYCSKASLQLKTLYR